MKKLIFPALLLCAAGAQAQSLDLFSDLNRNAGSELSRNAGFSPAVALAKTSFTVGTTGYTDLVIYPSEFLIPLNLTVPATGLPTYSNNAFVTDWHSVATTDNNGQYTPYKSRMAWNISHFAITSGDGVVYQPQAVSMYAVDVYPTIEAVVGKTCKFTVSCIPAGGTTPATLQFQTQTGGVWTSRFSLDLTKGTQRDVRSITFTSALNRARWLLVKNGSTNALCTINIQVEGQ